MNPTTPPPAVYLTDRELMLRASPAISDCEWLDIQADSYRRLGTAAGGLVAAAIVGVVARMEAAGVWAAEDLAAVEKDGRASR